MYIWEIGLPTYTAYPKHIKAHESKGCHIKVYLHDTYSSMCEGHQPNLLFVLCTGA